MKEGVIILGMPHSGTTYLAGLMKEHIKMHGEKGFYYEEATGQHWEDAYIVDINRREGQTIPMRKQIPDYKPSFRFKEKLRNYKLKRQAEGVPWGFKEPRCAVLAKAYMDVFRDCKFILCHRSPQRYAMTRYNNYGGRDPLGSISTYEHIHAGVLDTWREHRCQQKMFLFWYDGSKDFHKGQNEELNKYLGFDLDYLTDWKFEL